MLQVEKSHKNSSTISMTVIINISASKNNFDL